MVVLLSQKFEFLFHFQGQLQIYRLFHKLNIDYVGINQYFLLVNCGVLDLWRSQIV